jgi:hypothetical protein
MPLRMKPIDEMGKKKVMRPEKELTLSWAKLKSEFFKDLTVRVGGDKIGFQKGSQYLGSLKVSDVKVIKVISSLFYNSYLIG